jgi:hypothetical protein
MIATVAACGQAVGGRQTLKVSAGNIVQQQVVIEGKQFAEPLAQVLLDCAFVGQQPIQRAVKAIVVDTLDWEPKQIFQRGGAVPVLCDMQLAGGLS